MSDNKAKQLSIFLQVVLALFLIASLTILIVDIKNLVDSIKAIDDIKKMSVTDEMKKFYEGLIHASYGYWYLAVARIIFEAVVICVTVAILIKHSDTAKSGSNDDIQELKARVKALEQQLKAKDIIKPIVSRCENCGESISDTDRWCPKCKKRIER